MTDRLLAAAARRDLLDVVVAAVDAGARTILLREKDLSHAERTMLAKAVAELLVPVDGTLLVASDAVLARTVDAAGVHLAGADPGDGVLVEPQRFPSSPAGSRTEHVATRIRLVVGRSCHSVADLRRAEAAGLDYATLSPIWTTASKPGYGPGLGLGRLAGAVAAVPSLPIYALGGIGPGRAHDCQKAGAAGIAVMGEIMRADDPAATVRACLTSWQGSSA